MVMPAALSAQVMGYVLSPETNVPVPSSFRESPNVIEDEEPPNVEAMASRSPTMVIVPESVVICMPANFQSPTNVDAADELAAEDEALADADALLPDAAAELDPLPPQAASTRQHAHSMAAHINARILFMGVLSLVFLPCA